MQYWRYFVAFSTWAETRHKPVSYLFWQTLKTRIFLREGISDEAHFRVYTARRSTNVRHLRWTIIDKRSTNEKDSIYTWPSKKRLLPATSKIIRRASLLEEIWLYASRCLVIVNMSQIQKGRKWTKICQDKLCLKHALLKPFRPCYTFVIARGKIAIVMVHFGRLLALKS